MKSISDYVEMTAELLNLPIAPDYRPGVLANLEAIAEIARLVTEFPLDETVKSAAMFNPSPDEEIDDI